MSADTCAGTVTFCSCLLEGPSEYESWPPESWSYLCSVDTQPLSTFSSSTAAHSDTQSTHQQARQQTHVLTSTSAGEANLGGSFQVMNQVRQPRVELRHGSLLLAPRARSRPGDRSRHQRPRVNLPVFWLYFASGFMGLPWLAVWGMVWGCYGDCYVAAMGDTQINKYTTPLADAMRDALSPPAISLLQPVWV